MRSGAQRGPLGIGRPKSPSAPHGTARQSERSRPRGAQERAALRDRSCVGCRCGAPLGLDGVERVLRVAFDVTGVIADVPWIALDFAGVDVRVAVVVTASNVSDGERGRSVGSAVGLLAVVLCALLGQSFQSKPVSFSERVHSRSMTGLSWA